MGVTDTGLTDSGLTDTELTDRTFELALKIWGCVIESHNNRNIG